MRYQQAVSYLFGLQKFGIKLGLEKITRLLSLLGNPHMSLNCVHVAGTNGKGSTCAFLQSICRQSGYATGLYTSPHLIDFTERIRINDRCIPRAAVGEMVADIKKLCEKKSLETITFFEFVTALAFLYFKQLKADPIIVETGMGGKWDATNVIAPRLSVITSISLEHQKYLGRRLADIAGEKAGIIKPGVPLISGVTQESVKTLFRERCRAAGSPLLQRGKNFRLRRQGWSRFLFDGMSVHLSGLKCGLAGDHQIHNAGLATAAALQLRDMGYRIDAGSISSGLAKTTWAGRLEVLGQRPTVLADGAHNPEAWRALHTALTRGFDFRRLIFVLGVMEDKNIKEMLKILTRQAYAIIVCRPEMDRSAGKEVLQKFIGFSDKKKIFWRDKAPEAYAAALALARTDDLICITGSLFLVGELREMIINRGLRGSGRLAM